MVKYNMPEPQPPSDLFKHPSQIILENEVAEGIRNAGGSEFGFFNNFERLIPGGMLSQMATEIPGYRNKPLKDSIPPEKISFYSKLYLSQTRGEFLDSINNAADALEKETPGYKTHLEELRQTYSAIDVRHASIDEQNDAQNALLRYAIPLYIKLRMMGYSHYDLWR